MIELADDLFAIGLCLYVKSESALIISDIHLGFEEGLRKGGVLIPRMQLKDVLKELSSILELVSVKKIVLNGDVKHEFGAISDQEWRDILRFIDFFTKRNIEVIIIKGNHDPLLAPVLRRRDIVEVSELRFNNILIIHGDVIPKKLEKIIVMGHEHPAIFLKDKSKVEKFKCFLRGKWKRCTLIVQPSFNPLTVGVDVKANSFLGPILTNASRFDVFVVNEKSREVLYFGIVRDV